MPVRLEHLSDTHRRLPAAHMQGRSDCLTDMPRSGSGPRKLWMSRVVLRSFCAADSVVAHAVPSESSSISPGRQVFSNHGSRGP